MLCLRKRMPHRCAFLPHPLRPAFGPTFLSASGKPYIGIDFYKQKTHRIVK